MSGATLTVLCGLPASGKSTLARDIAARTGAVILSADRIRTERASPLEVFRWLHAQTTRHLAEGRSVIADTCALRAFERSRLRDIGRRCGARCVLVLVNTPWRLCMERDVVREQPARIKWLAGAALLREAADANMGSPLWDEVRVVYPATGEATS